MAQKLLYEIRAELLHYARLLVKAKSIGYTPAQIFHVGEQFAESLAEYQERKEKVRELCRRANQILDPGKNSQT